MGDPIDQDTPEERVAAAARALRGLDAPTGDAVPFLLQAVRNIRDADDAVPFETIRPRWPAAGPTTALEEILRTFAWLGAAGRSALPDLEALRAEPHALPEPARELLEAVLAGLGGHACCAPRTEPAGSPVGRPPGPRR
ncbi:MAG TPA: hypothetical protein VKG45_09765 [Actinomycetes bacterium]|nr:hypothetical protein [Actinomycetes bacterium]